MGKGHSLIFEGSSTIGLPSRLEVFDLEIN